MEASQDQQTEQHTVISACAGRLDENHFEIERIMEPLGEENHFIADTTEPSADEAGFTQETQPADEADLTQETQSADEADPTQESQPAAELDLTAGNIAASLPMTLVFEIGQMTVPLSALSQLKEGDVLTADFKTAPEIGIRTQGRLIATASLVRIGERLGAKITRLIAPDETR
ncbi:hypothetical protein BGZ96_006247 [Linnemannia gamsii]|uniref:Flagellar motor switch protein FliN-like C-terminal domain-containing protein n=1 Tax=Linnemannia gamsii TaxID=64522 RepID=A0ABQ7KG44_9FUNG|nr:hypothetical protein BGZ96_006247 [Linnemannia gamsii]